MHAILHDFPIACSPQQLFHAITTPAGLDTWWTATSHGEPTVGNRYELGFGPEYAWRAEVTACERDVLFELRMTHAMPDWMDTRVAFRLQPIDGGTRLEFAHTGWREQSAHYRTTSFCWAMYLRVMRRNLEFGELVEYERRLEV